MRTFHLLTLLALCVFASADAETSLSVEDTALVKDDALPSPTMPNAVQMFQSVLSTATDMIGYQEALAAVTLSTVTSLAVTWTKGLASVMAGASVVITSPWTGAALTLTLAINLMVMHHFSASADHSMVKANKRFRSNLRNVAGWYTRMEQRPDHQGVHAAFRWQNDIEKVNEEAETMLKQVRQGAMLDAAALQMLANKGSFWLSWKCMHCYNGACASKIARHPTCGVKPAYVRRGAQKWNQVKRLIVKQRNALAAFLHKKALKAAPTRAVREAVARDDTLVQKAADEAKDTELSADELEDQGTTVAGVDATTSVWLVVLLALAALSAACAFTAYRRWNWSWTIRAWMIFGIVPACVSLACVSLAIVVLWHHAYVSVHWLGVPICALVCFCVWMCGKLRGKAGAKPLNWADVKIDDGSHAHAWGSTPGYNMLGALTLDHSAVVNPSRPSSSLAILPAGKCIDCAETQARKARCALVQILSDPDARKTVQSELALIMTDAIHYNEDNEIEWCDHCQTWACNFTK